MEELPSVIRIIIYIFAFFIGASIFSFLEVITVRVPMKKSFVSGKSVCDSCGHELSALDMIPVFGWLLLGGKCRYCGAKFPPTSSIKEFFGGSLAVLCLLKFDISAQAVLTFAFICTLVPAAFISVKIKRIPYGFPIATALVGIASAFFSADIFWLDRLLGALCAGLPMLAVLIFRRGIGWGDVLLSAACGIFLGWRLELCALAFTVAFVLIWVTVLLILKKSERLKGFVFAPFFCACAALCAMLGTEIAAWL